MAGKGDTVKDGRRFIHGTLADRAMRKWLEQKDEQQPGQMASYVDELWDKLVTHSDEYKITWKGDVKKDQESVRQLAKKVVNNVEPFLFKKVLPFDYHPEFRFKIPVRIPDQFGRARTIILNGGMDILVRLDEEHYAIYDLKATTNEQYVRNGIMPQLIFYSIAATYLFGVQSDNITAAFLTPANKTKIHPLTLHAKDRKFLMSQIVSCAHSLWSDDPPTFTDDKNICYFCDCKRLCPLWAGQFDDDRNDGSHRISIVDTAKARADAKKRTTSQKKDVYVAEQEGFGRS